MIYIDTSVALAHLLAEDRQPPGSLWEGALFSSRLLEYEIWVLLNARGLADTYGEAARWLTGRVAMLELSPPVQARALDAFPGPGALRTLDALHLASCAYYQTCQESPLIRSQSAIFLFASLHVWGVAGPTTTPPPPWICAQ